MIERVWVGLAGVGASCIAGLTFAGLGGAPVWVLAGATGFGAASVLVVELMARPPQPSDAPHPKTTTAPDAARSFGQALLGRMPVPFLIIDDRRILTYANPAARALLPRLQSGQHIATQMRAPAVMDMVEQTARTGRETSGPFTSMSGSDLKLFARVAALPVDSDFGEAARVMVQIEDHTDEQRALAMRSDFIANASHELRTPLTSIIGYIETLQRHAEDDPAATEHFLGIMAQQAARMQRLIDDLMSLSRIEMTEHLRPDDTIELGEVLTEAITALEPQRTAYGVEMRIEPLARPMHVAGDRDQLLQVFTNLVDNAMKYGGTGVAVKIGEAAADLRFPGARGVAVADTGPGIPRADLPRLTERFYRIAQGRSPKKDGTGLGLAIVKHIINRHAGELDISSDLGQGSRFTIWLPEVQPSEGNPAALSQNVEETDT